PPTRKLLTLIFALVGKDEATELWFDHYPGDRQLRMFYRVGGQLFEMVPPPAHIWPELLSALLRDARLEPRPRRSLREWIGGLSSFPQSPTGGTLPVRFGGVSIEFGILFFRGRSGEHIWVEKTTPVSLKSAVEQFFREKYRKDRPAPLAEFSGSDSAPPSPPSTGPGLEGSPQEK
ncbi:MAG TPA: hypothetical protein VKE40_02570, partial [Gemmataceae bacterium]|nr:hypothetical protein [Gemmataceae bacterium]